MPSHDLHRLIGKLLLGIETSKTSDMMDYSAKNPVIHESNGKLVYQPMVGHHRDYFYHTLFGSAIAGLQSGEGIEAGLLHFITDKIFDGLNVVANEKVKQTSKPPLKRRIKNAKKIIDALKN